MVITRSLAKSMQIEKPTDAEKTEATSVKSRAATFKKPPAAKKQVKELQTVEEIRIPLAAQTSNGNRRATKGKNEKAGKFQLDAKPASKESPCALKREQETKEKDQQSTKIKEKPIEKPAKKKMEESLNASPVKDTNKENKLMASDQTIMPEESSPDVPKKKPVKIIKKKKVIKKIQGLETY
ncbi:uncharacterized protein LOC108117474 [Drosophila eugracilis]|uniref:uncharacterized protein LOC108117474 n=1 Tax=Drosophila eugracilis TaxID=29029 RepID=UPI001BDA8311|nr:uncharacterized protein LOC108117474 [Drosophila eugracilis]